MSYQSQLNNLMQMATIEQLNMLMNSNSNNNNKKEDSLGKDVLNLPIVQRVVAAYEDEIKAKDKASITTSCKCANYEHQFALILAKLDAQALAQDKALAQVLSKLEEIHASTKKLDVWSINDNPIVQESESYTVTLPREEEVEEEVEVVEEIKVEYQFADAEEEEIKEVEIKEVEIKPYKCEQHITLDIEELINVEIQSIVLSEAEDEVDEEVIEEEVVVEDLIEDLVEEEVVESDLLEEVVVVEDLEEVVVVEDLVEDLVVEEEVEEESEVEVESEEEVEVKEVLSEVVEEEEAEVFEIEIDDISYFATDEENGILYEVDSDGEVGKQVGIIKDGEPIFS
jgi:hypothetical protein